MAERKNKDLIDSQLRVLNSLDSLKTLIRKPTKTLSGVTPIAVMLPPRKCNHGVCIYCPSLNVPQSYTPKSPVVMRAAAFDYDSYKQVRARIKAFKAMGHPTDKIELIIMGGTFLEYPEEFQYEFIKKCYDALNSKKSKNLEEAKKLNETAGKHKCVALCIETRPDRCTEKDIKRMLEFGATRVELGVQIIDDKIYKKIKRGHTVKDVVNATLRLRDSGFKIGYHIMPGLPGSDFQKDLRLFKKMFSDQRFRPDQLKIYPCQVIQGSELEELYWKGQYKPYTKEEIEKLIIEMLKNTPRYCRVMRIMREIPPDYLVAGTTRIDLRKDIEEKLRKEKIKLHEIRYREIGFLMRDNAEIDFNLQLKITKYRASQGEEYFLEIVNKDDILFALLRLRIKNRKAMIRELHVYGQSARIGEKPESLNSTKKIFKVQHKGLGRWLVSEAENIAKKQNIKKLKIISGVGVRNYYRKIGYELEENYMVKNLS